MDFVYKVLYSQLFVTPPVPTTDFAGQTVIVTGSNTGLGFEAAKHLVRLGANKVILAVRTVEKGEAAKAKIEESTQRLGVLEVWQLELEKYDSVKRFAKKAEELPRLDAVVENAGVSLFNFRIAEKDEATMTVNVISTFLLALLLLPTLQNTARKFDVVPRISIVSSDLHFIADPNKVTAQNVIDDLNHKDKASMQERYPLSKLLQVLASRELAGLISTSSKPRVILNCTNPGLCHSGLMRDTTTIQKVSRGIVKFLIARSSEVGSRTVVAGIEAGEESHGQYMSDCKLASVSPFVNSPEGGKVQKNVWKELSQKLEEISPGILRNI